MSRHASLCCVLLIIVLSLAAPGLAHAQQPPECPGNSSSQASGEILGINSVEFPINLAPCQTLSVSVTTWDEHATYGASFTFQLCNNSSGDCTVPARTELETDHWSILNDPVIRELPNGAPWLPPYRGTRGAEGLPLRGILRTTSNVAGKIFYQVTISKVRRPDYNIGGSSIANAPVVTFGTTYRGSIHPWEPGQYFKVHLEPNQGFAVAGTVLGHSSYGPYWEIHLRNGAGTLVQTMAFGAAYGGPLPFSSNVYSNSSGAAQDLYVQFRAQYYPIHDFQIAFEAPRLTLFLDADQNFNPSSPHDDSPDYLPCSRLDGSSLPLSECPQTVKAIAAYTVGGFIVRPPTTGSVTFSLQNTSAFTGVAMNYGTGVEPDFALPEDVPSKVVTFAPNARTVSVDLIARDYGGFTTVRANTVEMKVPRRDDLLPEAGWKVYPTPFVGPAEHVEASGREPDADRDPTPDAVGPPADPESGGLRGDGVTTYEEYRGFIAFGSHIRTHPDKKDFFIAGDDEVGGFGIGYAANLPLKVHHICDPTVALGCGLREYSETRVVNANRSNAAGAAISGIDQRGVRLAVLEQAVDPLLAGCVFGFTWGTGYPVPLTLSFSPTELSPNETLTVEVYREPHNGLGHPQTFNDCGPGNLPGPLSAADVEAATFMTMGHEVGHALHVCHTNDTEGGGIAYACVGGAVLQTPTPVPSVMFSGIRLPIPGSTDPGAQYSPTDAGQIRLHVRQ
jgi:hypothetical protein